MTPGRDRDGKSDARAVFIEQAPAAEHAESVCRGERTGDIAVLDIVPANFVLKRLGEEAEHLTIDVVNGGGKEEERANGPANVGSGGAECGKGHEGIIIICRGELCPRFFSGGSGDRVHPGSRDLAWAIPYLRARGSVSRHRTAQGRR